MTKLMLILADQLYQDIPFADDGSVDFVVVESTELCERFVYHKYKLTYLLTCMRRYSGFLRGRFTKSTVHYYTLDQGREFSSVLGELCKEYDSLLCFEIDDKGFALDLKTLTSDLGIVIETIPSPKFLLTPEEIDTYYNGAKPKRNLMNDFYIWQRKRLSILVDKDLKPVGEKWSFDQDNRKKLPKDITLPNPTRMYKSNEFDSVSHIITQQFTTNPGKLSNASWLPTTHAESIDWLREFLKERFVLFGDYEDALTDRSNIVFHSAISPMLNNGLLTPKQILAELENYLNEEYGFSIFDYDLNKNQHSPSFLNSIEGFVRQLIGWREWIRIMYLKEYEIKLSSYNFFKATNPLPPYFWDLNPDDPAIKDNIPLQNVLTKIDSYGWSHHIERLMVLSNWMLLNEYDPIECLDWFKAMYVDAYDWVMVPNVLGMGLFADGGIFATKPYVAGGNYLKKMSDYPDSKKWESIWTDKFWDFLIKHQEYFKTNPRMNMLIQTRLKK